MSAEPLERRYALSPEVEEDRLRAVEELSLLDTPRENRFAQITRLARHVFEVPMAAVSLMDRDRQWFKQTDGMELEESVPRSQTVCQAVVLRGYEHPERPELILEDTWDSEFRDLPAVKADGGIRFYAGYPLYGPGGHVVGSFCIYDTEPRTLSDAERTTFAELAGWAQRELQRTDDLERAAAVQRQMLPRALGELPGYAVCALSLPAYAVGGDFYDHYPVRNGVIFTVADVMGKGIGAAILAATVRSAMRGVTRAFDRTTGDVDLAAAVNSAYLEIADDLECTDSFVTLFHMKLATADGTVQYVDAGHGFAAVVRRDGTVTSLTSDELPLGILPDDHWVRHDVALRPGDSLVIASDGALDLAAEDEDLGAERAKAFIALYPDPAELCAQARRMFERKPPLDDVTIVAIRCEREA